MQRDQRDGVILRAELLWELSQLLDRSLHSGGKAPARFGNRVWVILWASGRGRRQLRRESLAVADEEVRAVSHCYSSFRVSVLLARVLFRIVSRLTPVRS